MPHHKWVLWGIAPHPDQPQIQSTPHCNAHLSGEWGQYASSYFAHMTLLARNVSTLPSAHSIWLCIHSAIFMAPCTSPSSEKPSLTFFPPSEPLDPELYSTEYASQSWTLIIQVSVSLSHGSLHHKQLEDRDTAFRFPCTSPYEAPSTVLGSWLPDRLAAVTSTDSAVTLKDLLEEGQGWKTVSGVVKWESQPHFGCLTGNSG